MQCIIYLVLFGLAPIRSIYAQNEIVSARINYGSVEDVQAQKSRIEDSGGDAIVLLLECERYAEEQSATSQDLLRLFRIGEDYASIQEDSTAFFEDMAQVFWQKTTEKLQERLSTGEYSTHRPEVKRLKTLLEEKHYHVHIPPSDWEKAWQYILEGRWGYVLRRTWEKHPYWTLIAGTGVFFLIGCFCRRIWRKYLKKHRYT